MKIKGTTEIEVEVTLPEIMNALKEEMIRISTNTDLSSPQVLAAKIFEADNGEMWVKESRFDQSFHYPVPEKAQEIVKAIKNLLCKYRDYVSQ